MYSLAQVNIARALAPLDDPIMADFVARLDEVNALADKSPGFIWRLQTPDGNANSRQSIQRSIDYFQHVGMDHVKRLFQLCLFKRESAS